MSLFGQLVRTRRQRRGADARPARSTPARVDHAIAHGLAYVTEDRKALGLVLDDTIAHNISLANLRGVSRGRRDRQRPRVRGGQRLPAPPGHPLHQRRAAGGQPVGRQPAEGGARQMAVRRPRGADPRRADARHRRRRQVRDLHVDGRARRRRQVHRDDLLGDARAAGHVRPHLRDERRPLRRRVRGRAKRRRKRSCTPSSPTGITE